MSGSLLGLIELLLVFGCVIAYAGYELVSLQRGSKSTDESTSDSRATRCTGDEPR